MFYPEAETGFDVGVVDIESRKLTPLIHTAAAPRFSPDEESIAYVSTEMGRREVFIKSLRTGEQTQVSNGDGGSEPRWRRDGRELFYLGADRNLMAVSIGNADGHLTATLGRTCEALSN